MFVPLLGLYTDSTGLRPVSPRGLVRALGSVVDAVAYGRDVTRNPFHYSAQGLKGRHISRRILAEGVRHGHHGLPRSMDGKVHGNEGKSLWPRAKESAIFRQT